MAISLEGSIIARREAPLHVQLVLTKKPEHIPVPNGGDVTIEGVVVKVFRGGTLVGPGETIAFQLWVCGQGGEPSGVAYVYHEALMKATHLEAFLYGRPPQCRLAAHEFELLEAPIEEPTMTVAELERLRWGH